MQRAARSAQLCEKFFSGMDDTIRDRDTYLDVLAFSGVVVRPN
jgi:hypothetical protein